MEVPGEAAGESVSQISTLAGFSKALSWVPQNISGVSAWNSNAICNAMTS